MYSSEINMATAGDNATSIISFQNYNQIAQQDIQKAMTVMHMSSLSAETSIMIVWIL